jgi:4'-phosphopantetheinyl transferase
MGKPVIASCHDDLARWQFNLSGSRNMVVVAICKGRAVGVDIELSAVANELLDSPLIFSLCERASLQKLPLDERKRRFLDHWAIKEAYLKASGKGMSIPLNSIAPDFGEPGRIRFSAIGGDEPLHANWTFMQLDVSGHGTVSICLEGTAMPATELALFMPFNSPPRNLSFRILRRS